MNLQRQSLLTKVGTVLMIAGGALIATVVVIFVLPWINGPDPSNGEAVISNVPSTFSSTNLPMQLPTPLAAFSEASAIVPTGASHFGNYPKSLGSKNAVRPSRLVIPSLGIDANVQPVSLETVGDGRDKHTQWSVPDGYAVGWHDQSAPPGQPGNTVLNGHNNINGAIFRDLANLKPGEKIVLYYQDQVFTYKVVQQEYLKEAGQSLQTRVMNARWILPTDDERVTLVTCWPNSSNSHRLVIIAMPVDGNS